MNTPRVSSYMNPSKVNAMRATIGQITVWFSYDTFVAFKLGGGDPVVCENIWGNTTGKHLNSIDLGEKSHPRVTREEFLALWAKVAPC